jgi:hypothetical protein
MARSALTRTKINTEVTQTAYGTPQGRLTHGQARTVYAHEFAVRNERASSWMSAASGCA